MKFLLKMNLQLKLKSPKEIIYSEEEYLDQNNMINIFKT